jgi:hypothetical protein
MNLKFPQFNVEINNPTIEVDLNTIGDRAIDKLLSVEVILKTDSASFGVRANGMPYQTTWEDNDIRAMVLIWLAQFEI